MRPAFRRGSEGEGKLESLPWRGPAGEARHTGVTIGALGTRGQSPWCSQRSRKWSRQAPLLLKKTEPSGSHTFNNGASAHPPQRGTGNGTLAAAKPAGWCARAIVRQRPSGHEPRKRASGSVQKRRTLKERSGKECDYRHIPLIISALLRSRSFPGWTKTSGLVRDSE
jgi:hypothetical protein